MMEHEPVSKVMAAVEGLLAKPGDDWCVTLEISGSGDWVQLKRGIVNAYYPYANDPLVQWEKLSALLPDLQLTEWEEETFATFAHGECSAETIAKAADFLLTAIPGSPDYELEITVDKI